MLAALPVATSGAAPTPMAQSQATHDPEETVTNGSFWEDRLQRLNPAGGSPRRGMTIGCRAQLSSLTCRLSLCGINVPYRGRALASGLRVITQSLNLRVFFTHATDVDQ
jgi:hypothetical protein